MKKIKNILMISSYVLLVTLFFFCGYVLGTSKTNGDNVEVSRYTEVEDEAREAEVVPEYELIIQDGILMIYRCVGESKSVVVSEMISENVFPKEDIEQLKKGVRFERLEQAQQMFENFVS